MRHQLYRPAVTVAGVAAALAVCAGPGAAAARTGGSPAAASVASPALGAGIGFPPDRGPAAADATGRTGCITILNLGPRAAAGAGFRTLSRSGTSYRLPAAGTGGRAVWQVTRTGLTRLRPGTAGAGPAAVRPASAPGARTYTVTVVGTNIAGQPAGGRNADVFLINADDPARSASVARFAHGVAKFRVPAGRYWALADFIRPLPGQQNWDEYLDVLPPFPVARDTTVHAAARAATGRVGAVLPRPATEQLLNFQLIRFATAGPPVSLGWLLNNGGPKIPTPALYVSPAAGKLATVTSEQWGSGAFPSDSRRLYDAAYQSAGTTPSHQYVVNPAALATVHLRYYSAVRSAGLSGTFPAFPVNNVCPLGGATFGGMRFPARQTAYLSASRALSWRTQFIQNEARDFSGGQVGPPQAFVPGEHQTQDFGAYPLHPAPNTRLSDIASQPPVPVSAARAGNTLRLALTAFSDSVPGHAGQGTFPPVRTAASYQIDQNGTKIAGGPVPRFTGAFDATAALSPAPSVIRFSLNAAESATLNPLSTASRTVWTWRSAPAQGARLPAGWTCQPGHAADRACQVQPMMTLRYGVVGLRLNGSAAPGQQVVRVLVGHLQLARAANVTGATVSVSFDGGKTWRAARMTGRGGSYAAVFRAPPGARVTLRTSASDAAGGSVTETVTRAYQVGS